MKMHSHKTLIDHKTMKCVKGTSSSSNQISNSNCKMKRMSKIDKKRMSKIINASINHRKRNKNNSNQISVRNSS